MKKFNLTKVDITLIAVIILLLGAVLFLFLHPETPSSLFKKNFKYTIDGNQVYAVSYSGDLANVEIPQKVWIKGKKYKVTKILDNTFKDNAFIRTVALPDSIIYIGDSAFENCTKLEEITIPKSCTQLGQDAFSNCTNVKTLKYLSSKKCKVPLGGDVFKNVGKNVDGTHVEIGEDVKYLPSFLFATSNISENICIKEIVFNTTKCKTIGESVFQGADVKTVNFPQEVTSIGKNTFKSSTVSEVTFGDNLEFLPDYMFYNCKNLQHIEIAQGIKIVGVRCFAQSGLISINIPESVEYIGTSAFANSKLQIINYSGNSSTWNTINVDIVKSTEFINSKVIFEKGN